MEVVAEPWQILKDGLILLIIDMWNLIENHGMIFKKKLKRSYTEDYVMIRMHSGEYLHREVTWLGGVPYSYSINNEKMCRLLPDSKLEGQSYEKSWQPASENMLKYYNGSNVHES